MVVGNRLHSPSRSGAGPILPNVSARHNLRDEFDEGDGQDDNADRHQPQTFAEGSKVLGHLGTQPRYPFRHVALGTA